jgi:hypothetical protein
MREDMFEVIIERPRGGNWPRKPGRPPRELDDAPRFESTSRKRGGTKWLNENLAPLVRFLCRRVGRPWNDVHREMAAQLSLGSAVQKHVLDHVRQMVEVHAVLIDGKPHHPDAYRGGPIEAGHRGHGFYVCPLTGTLQEAPRRARQRRKPAPQPLRVRLPFDGEYEAWRIDGIWYQVRLAPVPAEAGSLRGVRDMLLNRGLDENGMLGHGGALVRHYGRHRFAASKVQLSWRDIRDLKLPR